MLVAWFPVYDCSVPAPPGTSRYRQVLYASTVISKVEGIPYGLMLPTMLMTGSYVQLLYYFSTSFGCVDDSRACDASNRGRTPSSRTARSGSGEELSHQPHVVRIFSVVGGGRPPER